VQQELFVENVLLFQKNSDVFLSREFIAAFIVFSILLFLFFRVRFSPIALKYFLLGVFSLAWLNIPEIYSRFVSVERVEIANDRIIGKDFLGNKIFDETVGNFDVFCVLFRQNFQKSKLTSSVIRLDGDRTFIIEGMRCDALKGYSRKFSLEDASENSPVSVKLDQAVNASMLIYFLGIAVIVIFGVLIERMEKPINS
jgi:hypothetical protein